MEWGIIHWEAGKYFKGPVVHSRLIIVLFSALAPLGSWFPQTTYSHFTFSKGQTTAFNDQNDTQQGELLIWSWELKVNALLLQARAAGKDRVQTLHTSHPAGLVFILILTGWSEDSRRMVSWSVNYTCQMLSNACSFCRNLWCY